MKNLAGQFQKFSIEWACAVIHLYQRTLSPDHGAFQPVLGFMRCRFSPSCSAYAASAIRQYGLLQGFVVSLKRILRCNPWNSGGYDPPY